MTKDADRGEPEVDSPSSEPGAVNVGLVIPPIVVVGLLLWGARLPIIDELSGPPRFLRLLVEVVGTAAVVSILVGLGGFVLRGSFSHSLPVLYLVACFIVGVGVLGGVLVAAGLLGILSRSLVVGLVLVGSVAGILSNRNTRLAASSSAETLRRVLESGPGRIVLVTHLVLGSMLLVAALAPTQAWDSLMYHLTLPQEFLEAGRVFVPDDNLHVAFIGPLHMIHMTFGALGIARGPALLAAVSVILCAAVVGATCAAVAGRKAAYGGSILVWSMTGLAMTGATAGIDPFLVLALGMANGLLVIALMRREPRLLVPVGILIGVAMATRYTAAPFVLGLAIVVVVGAASFDRGAWKKPLLLGAMAGAALWTPWLLKNQLLFGGSLYPFFAQRLVPDWITRLPNSDSLGAVLDTHSPLLQVRRPFSVWSWLVEPERLTVEVSGSRQGLSAGLFGSALLGLRGSALMVALGFGVPAVVHVIGVYLASPETNLRYLLPVVPGLAVLGGLGLKSTLNTRAGVVLVAFVIAISVVPTTIYLENRVLKSGDIGYLAGGLSIDAWAERPNNEDFAWLASADGWLRSFEFNRTLLLIESREGGFSGNVIQDILLENWPLLVEGLDGRCLPAGLADSILVNEGALTYYEDRGLDLESIAWQEFQPFADRCLEYLGREVGYALYSVRDNPYNSPLQRLTGADT